MTTSDTKWLWPRRARCAYPQALSSGRSVWDPPVRRHTMTDLSREEERTRFGSSWVVAMDVTQSLWPVSVPRRVSVSVMVEVLLG